MKKIMFITVLLATYIIIYIYYPVKISCKSINKIDNNYIICEMVKTTGFDWRVVDSSTGYTGLAFLEGNINDINKLKYHIEWGHNKFVMYTAKESEQTFCGEKYPLYTVSSWEILYPVKRDIFLEFFFPDYGLTNFDF